MGFKIQPINLGMVDTSEATSKDRLFVHLTDGECATGHLILRLCDHVEGKGHKFCLDSTSHHASLTEKLRISGHMEKDGTMREFPHISLIGLPSEGDYPRIEIYSDRRLQRRYVLSTIIRNFDASIFVSLAHRQLMLASA
jgi:hypothetical protein